MNDIVHIGNTDISVKEYRGQRVVTFRDIDAVHGRPAGTARKRFADNRNRFIEGEDYFVVTPKKLEESMMSEKRTSGISEVNPRGTAFITEQGYLMLVKSFTDDLAWKVQRQLVSSYFKVRQTIDERLSPETKMLFQMINQIATSEIKAKEAKELAEKAVKTTEAIKDAVKPIFDNWRVEINSKFNRIQKNVEQPFNVLRGEMYKELEKRAGCNLDIRFKHRRENMEKNGCSKSKINSLNKMDVIEEEKKLREIFSKIVSEYEIKYCS